MNGLTEVKRVVDTIAGLFTPEKIILYAKKINFETDDIKSFSICVILQTENTQKAEQFIYLNVDSEIPFDVLVYTPEEWERLVSNKYSFVHNTVQKGNVLYEKR